MNHHCLNESNSAAQADIFDKCVNRLNDGKTIECKLGLWGVASGSKNRTEAEALHYWRQYFRDGEYNHLLLKIKK